jgi:hypothetical protein
VAKAAILVCVVLAIEMVAVAIAVHTYAIAGMAVVCSAVFGCGLKKTGGYISRNEQVREVGYLCANDGDTGTNLAVRSVTWNRVWKGGGQLDDWEYWVEVLKAEWEIEMVGSKTDTSLDRKGAQVAVGQFR